MAFAMVKPLDMLKACHRHDADGLQISTLRAGQTARNVASLGLADGTASHCAVLLTFQTVCLRGERRAGEVFGLVRKFDNVVTAN